MQPHPRPDAWQVTDRGQSRDHNEDFCGRFEPDDPAVASQRGWLYVVADGIGGQRAGEIASRYAVEQVLFAYYSDAWIDAAANLTQAIQGANADLFREAQQNSALRGMGTTVVAAAIQGDMVTVANVGDSRAYLIRDGEIRQLTEDHSWVAEQVARNVLTEEQARHHPQRNIITRSLGNDPTVDVDIFRQSLQSGDALVLCTDGLSGVVSAEETASAVGAAGTHAAAESLVKLANARGGPDNVTVTVVRMVPAAVREEAVTPIGVPAPEPAAVREEAVTPIRVPAPEPAAARSSNTQWLALGMIAVAVLGLVFVVPRLNVQQNPLPTATATLEVLPTATATSEGLPTPTVTSEGLPTVTATSESLPTATSAALFRATLTATWSDAAPSSTAVPGFVPTVTPDATRTGTVGPTVSATVTLLPTSSSSPLPVLTSMPTVAADPSPTAGTEGEGPGHGV